MKKGLAVVYDPHNLYQFVWYYCNRGKAKHWDALCLPNGYKGEYMHSYCEAAGIFDKVYRDDTDFSTLSAGKKLLTFLQMCGYFVLGRQKNFCRKLLNQYINCDDYDEMVVIGDMGVVSGACIALGQEKEVVVLEDGIGDYTPRKKRVPRERWASAHAWQGFFLSRMGYCAPGWYELATNQWAVKYSSQPEKMPYRSYREIRQLYAEEGTDQDLFRRILAKLYPELEKIDFEKAEAVLMTRPLSDYVSEYGKYQNRLEKYITERYHNLLLKKHPREKDTYHFGKSVVVQEVDNSIPAEALLPYLAGKKCIVIPTTAVMMYLKAYNIQCTVLEFSGLFEENKTSNSQFAVLSKTDVVEFCDKFLEENYSLEEL